VLKLRKSLTPTKIWGTFAVLQGIILLILLLTFPPITLSLIVPASEVTYWTPLIQGFEAEHPDIRINVLGVKNPQGDITEKLKELCTINFVTGNSLCDLIYTDVAWLPEFAEAEWLMDLSNRLSPAEREAFVTPDLEASSYNSRLYRVPFRSDVGLLYYRRDLLEAAQLTPPETFNDLVNISKTLQQQGVVDYGYLWQGKNYEGLAAVFLEVLEGHGGFWVNPETQEVGLDQPEAVAAVEFLVQILEENISPQGVLTYAEDESFQQFVEGSAVFLRNWSDVGVRSNLATSPLLKRIGIIPMRLQMPPHTGGGTNGSWGLGIEKNSQNPDQAWEVIQYLTSRDTQRRFVLETGYLPSRKALYNDSEITAKYFYFPELLEAVQTSILRPYIPEYAEVSEILQKYLRLALQQQITPTAAMDQAATETRELFANPTAFRSR
jgi:multiple sugar transport system substrate-binding protein